MMLGRNDYHINKDSRTLAQEPMSSTIVEPEIILVISSFQRKKLFLVHNVSCDVLKVFCFKLGTKYTYRNLYSVGIFDSYSNRPSAFR